MELAPEAPRGGGGGAPPVEPLLFNVLFSTDFAKVDEPLFSALSLNKQTFSDSTVVPSYVNTIFQQVQESQELAHKRFLWLVLCIVHPPIQQYILSTTPPESCETIANFLTFVQQQLDSLFTGGFSNFDNEIGEFLALVQIEFNK